MMEYGFNISFTMTSFLKTNNFPPFRFDELMTFRHFLKKKFLYFKSPKTAAIWEKKICLIYMYWIWHNLNLNRLRSAMINKVVRYFLEGNVHLIYICNQIKLKFISCDKSINKINKKKSFFFIFSFCISQKWLKEKNYQILSIEKLSVFIKL